MPAARRDRLSDWRASAALDEDILQRAETCRDDARFFKGFDDIAHEDAQARPYVRVIEVPRRQLGVDAVIADNSANKAPG